MKHKKVNIVTCTDWNYRHWAETLLKSLKGTNTGDFHKKIVIGVGDGDWGQFALQYGVDIIRESWKEGEDRTLWCQNVRMKHLRDLIDDVHWLLMLDADVRQNRPMDIRRFKAINAPSYAVVKHVGKQDKQGRYTVVDTRFRVNAGWVLFRNNKQNKSNLQQIKQEFKQYSNTPQWDQIMLWKYFSNTYNLPHKYVDDGAKGGFKGRSHWWHCKGPGRKQKTNLESWHNLKLTPKLT
tara:strand:- start:33 stop:743 length:711 start_codon:yes stop_codon:yes gene_type:complete